ncbi:MAG: PQQ-binding-like beta-propeller repeat protein [Gemmataceae bacterium]
MLITVVCPSCESRFQLKPELRGQKIRCPSCRKVFEVREAEAAETTPAKDPLLATDAPKPETSGGTVRTGSVGELVPILPAEAVSSVNEDHHAAPSPIPESVPLLAAELAEEAAPPKPDRRPAPAETKQAVSWQDQPPPVRQGTPLPEAAPPDQPMVEKTWPDGQDAYETDAGPRELPPGSWEPPPVRRGLETTPSTPEPSLPPVSSSFHNYDATPQRRRTGLYLFLMMFVFCAVIGGGIGTYLYIDSQSETHRFQRAKDDMDKGRYGSAETAFSQLQEDFPDSNRILEYRFHAGLCRALKPSSMIGPSTAEKLTAIQQYLNHPDNAKAVRDFHYTHLIESTLGKLAAELASSVTQLAEHSPPRLEEARQARAKAAEALELRQHYVKDKHQDETQARLAQQLADGSAAIERAERKLDLLTALEQIRSPFERIRFGEERARREGLDGDTDINVRLDGLRADLLQAVTYTPYDESLPAVTAAGAVAVGGAHSYLAVAALVVWDGAGPATDGWNTGGAASLVEVPALRETAASTASTSGDGVILALARGVLYALSEKTGAVRWAARVGIDTLTPPTRLPANELSPELVLVLSSEHNTLTARQAANGQAVWTYALRSPCLGQPVVVGRRAYVPTLDGKIHEIETVTGRPLGWYDVSLPLSTGGARQTGTNLLYFPAEWGYVFVLDVAQRQCVAILQSDHLSGALLSPPIVDVGSANPNIRPPYLILSLADGLNAMKLRTYRLPIEGVQQLAPMAEVRVRGWSAFPPYIDHEKIGFVTDAGVVGLFGINQAGNHDQPLFPLLAQELALTSSEQEPSRAQLVHAEEFDYWVIAGGEVQRLRVGLDRAKGLRAEVLPWDQPVRVGAPVHAAQLSADRDTFYLVTRKGPNYLATAVAAWSGQVLWQRQLGIVCRDDLLLHDGNVVALDEGGGLYLFDPAGTPHRRDLAPPLLEPVIGKSYFLPSQDRQSAYAVACVDEPLRLLVRRFTVDETPRRWEIPLPAPLAGQPALGEDCLILPLRNGVLYQWKLGAPGPLQGGMDWRHPFADPNAPGHVLHLGEDDFLVTDGSTGLNQVYWPIGRVWKSKNVNEGNVLDIQRIVAAPVLTPGSDMKSHICLADVRGAVLLLQRESFKPLRRWQLGGTITAGPFARGTHLGCVLDQRRLVWLHPDQDQPSWEYTAAADIVGYPHVIKRRLVVADRAGAIRLVDVETGKALGPGHIVSSIAVPTTAPIAFGTDHVFTPLSDGTLLILTVSDLEKTDP